MGRWPQQSRSTLVTFVLMFLLFPPIHAVAYVLTVRDNRFVDVILTRFGKCPITRNHRFWGGDSWVFSNSEAYRFGQSSSFHGQRFDSYDITLWLYETIDYPANGWVTVDSKFGENDGGDLNSNCYAESYLFLDPPN